MSLITQAYSPSVIGRAEFYFINTNTWRVDVRDEGTLYAYA